MNNNFSALSVKRRKVQKKTNFAPVYFAAFILLLLNLFNAAAVIFPDNPVGDIFRQAEPVPDDLEIVSAAQIADGEPDAELSDYPGYVPVSNSDVPVGITNHTDVNTPDYRSEYYIIVYTLNNRVLVLQKDENGGYTKEAAVFRCSTGTKDNPTQSGMYVVWRKFRWKYMMNVYVQYATSFSNGYLFHSIPYSKNGDPSTLIYTSYMNLGHLASHGCVRLCARDAKWIFDNIPYDTQVRVIRDKECALKPVPVPKLYTNGASKYYYWDPTDDTDENPYILDPPANLEYF